MVVGWRSFMAVLGKAGVVSWLQMVLLLGISGEWVGTALFGRRDGLFRTGSSRLWVFFACSKDVSRLGWELWDAACRCEFVGCVVCVLDLNWRHVEL